MGKKSIRIFEVGPRDGLQNEAAPVSLKTKIQYVNSLIQAGVQDLEMGAFVRPDRVPQMADTDRLYASIQTGQLKLGSSKVWCLVPNRVGLERALKAGATRIAVFTAATESFTRKNIGMSISKSILEFAQVIRDGRAHLGKRLHVRGYVSTAFGCPFEGRVAPSSALKVIEQLADLGVDQISIGDTIGVATPKEVERLIKPVLKRLDPHQVAVHFHDTRGTALANALRSIDLGVSCIDSSAGGLGGCPFAPGAAGNLATEDLIYMLNGMNMKTGIDLDRLCDASLQLFAAMKKPVTSRYLQAYSAHCEN